MFEVFAVSGSCFFSFCLGGSSGGTGRARLSAACVVKGRRGTERWPWPGGREGKGTDGGSFLGRWRGEERRRREGQEAGPALTIGAAGWRAVLGQAASRRLLALSWSFCPSSSGERRFQQPGPCRPSSTHGRLHPAVHPCCLLLRR